MRYIYLLVLTILVFANSSHAQQASSSFTLEQAISYALENAIDKQNATLDERIAEAKVKETVGLGLPQINGNASITHNEKLPRFFTTYDPNGGFIDLSGVPGIQAGDVVGAQNFFQLKSGGDVGVHINQLIFNGSYLVGLQASNAYKELAYKTTAQTEEKIIQSVSKAFYTVLINKERLDLFDNNIARLDTLLRNTKAQYESGFAESIDVDRIKVTYNNLIAERSKFANLNSLGIVLLKFQMNFPFDQDLTVAGTIQDIKVDIDINTYKADWDYKERPDYQVLEANRRLQQLNVKNQYAAGMPVLSANANLGYSTQSPNVGGLFKTNSNIEDQFGVGPDKWYGYSSFGLTLSVPIFSGLQRTYKIKQEKLTLQKIENGFSSLKRAVDLEIEQSFINFDNAQKTANWQKENTELAEKIARVTKIKYEQGVGSNLEVVDAENSLRQAQTNYYSALFDLMIAKVDLDKALGRLKKSSN